MRQVEYQKEYRKKHKEYFKIYRKQYHQNNKEKELKQSKEYQENNREKWVEYNKKYRGENPEYTEYIKKYGQEHREDHNKCNRKWLKTEKGKASNQRSHTRRRAKEREILNTLTAEEWISILKQYKFKCAYCGKEFTLFNRETRDHVIPISKGGNNVKDNVVPACRSCNTKKGNKILIKKGDK